MHQMAHQLQGANPQDTFNSLYLGFFHASMRWFVEYTWRYFRFQFPLLGIFPCIADRAFLLVISLLSIPFTWDFSMHRIDTGRRLYSEQFFQFPLLGIFPCIKKYKCKNGMGRDLSIPFTWDFSMHRAR